MKLNLPVSLFGAIIIAVLPSCVPPQPMGPPPGYHGGGPGYGHGPVYRNGGPRYPGGYRQIGDPTQNIYGNGPQSYARWGPQPAIWYHGDGDDGFYP